MEAESALKKLDEIKLIRRRFELMTVSRYRDKSKMRKAMEIQDVLRRGSRKSDWDSTKELRKWRDARYGSSGA